MEVLCGERVGKQRRVDIKRFLDTRIQDGMFDTAIGAVLDNWDGTLNARCLFNWYASSWLMARALIAHANLLHAKDLDLTDGELDFFNPDELGQFNHMLSALYETYKVQTPKLLMNVKFIPTNFTKAVMDQMRLCNVEGFISTFLKCNRWKCKLSDETMALLLKKGAVCFNVEVNLEYAHFGDPDTTNFDHARHGQFSKLYDADIDLFSRVADSVKISWVNPYLFDHYAQLLVNRTGFLYSVLEALPGKALPGEENAVRKGVKNLSVDVAFNATKVLEQKFRFKETVERLNLVSTVNKMVKIGATARVTDMPEVRVLKLKNFLVADSFFSNLAQTVEDVYFKECDVEWGGLNWSLGMDVAPHENLSEIYFNDVNFTGGIRGQQLIHGLTHRHNGKRVFPQLARVSITGKTLRNTSVNQWAAMNIEDMRFELKQNSISLLHSYEDTYVF